MWLDDWLASDGPEVPKTDATEDDLIVHEVLSRGCAHRTIALVEREEAWKARSEVKRKCEFVVCRSCGAEDLYRLIDEDQPSWSPMQLLRAKIPRYSQDRILSAELRRLMQECGWHVVVSTTGSATSACATGPRGRVELDGCNTVELVIARLAVKLARAGLL
jgi:hypothetical protein